MLNQIIVGAWLIFIAITQQGMCVKDPVAETPQAAIKQLLKHSNSSYSMTTDLEPEQIFKQFQVALGKGWKGRAITSEHFDTVKKNRLQLARDDLHRLYFFRDSVEPKAANSRISLYIYKNKKEEELKYAFSVEKYKLLKQAPPSDPSLPSVAKLHLQYFTSEDTKGLALTFAESIDVWSLKDKDLADNGNSTTMSKKNLLAKYNEAIQARKKRGLLVENYEHFLGSFQYVEIEKPPVDGYQFKLLPGDKLISCEQVPQQNKSRTVIILHLRKFGETWKVVSQSDF